MNTLEITKEKNPNSFGDIIKVIMIDDNGNAVKDSLHTYFDVHDSIDIEANKRNRENMELRCENKQLKEDIQILNSYIDVLRRNIKELQELQDEDY